MDLRISSIMGVLITVWYFIKKWISELSRILEPLIKEVEKMAIDGIIDKAERKILVMKVIAILEEQKRIKLNYVTRFIVSKIADKIAHRLPDFKITKTSHELLEEANKKN